MKSEIEPTSQGKVIIVQHHAKNEKWHTTLVEVYVVPHGQEARTWRQLVANEVKP